MPDIPEAAIQAAAEAMNEAHAKRGWNKPAPWWVNEVATAILEAAAPILAEACAQAILGHAERQHPRDPDHLPDAYHRHFSTAARVAAGAFGTREDQLRMAAQAIERGQAIFCFAPEDQQPEPQ